MQDSTTPDLPRSNRKAGLLGGVVGSIGLAASIFALTATAGAAAPVLQAQNTESEPVPVVDEGFPDEEAWTEFETCIDAVFESQAIDVDKVFGDVELFEMDEFEGEFDIEGEFDDFDFGPAVSIMDGEDMSFAEFGDGDGSITITKTGDDISVTSNGDVTLEELDWDDLAGEGIAVEGIAILEGESLDGDFEMFERFDDEAFDELDEALSACDDKLPEGVDLDHGFGDAEEAELAEVN